MSQREAGWVLRGAKPSLFQCRDAGEQVGLLPALTLSSERARIWPWSLLPHDPLVVTDVFSPGPVVLMFSGPQELGEGTEMAAALTIPGPTLLPRRSSCPLGRRQTGEERC